MKLITKLTMLAILSATTVAGFAASKADYQVVPVPNSINISNGKGFTLNDKTVIVASSSNTDLGRNAGFLADFIKESTGLQLKVVSTSPKSNYILLSDSLGGENKEAYRIEVNNNAITVDGASASGNYYGIQTLRKSIPAGEKGNVMFPAAVISDAPRFGYRGAHFDVARHFFPADSVKTYIDMIAMHNMNRLHWHLTDDQGWRLPLLKHPELITKGSVRRGTCIGQDFDSCDDTPYGGFFTRQEIDDVIKYAADRYITIIPEIDLPGHMLAALTAHPDLGCTGGPYELWTIWGVSEDVLCAGNQDMYKLLDEILSETAEIFPSEYIHIGGDECPKDRWKACEKCQAKIAELGYTDDEDSSKEEKLQSYVMKFATDVLARHGKKIIGWDEILEGGAPDDAVVMSWRGAVGGKWAAMLGHDAIMSPYTHYYLDYYQSEDRDNEPLSIGGYIPLSKAYSFDPYEDIEADKQHHILGVQANLWTEYIHTFDHAQYMVLPRWAALSEVQWSDPSSRDFDAFLKRLSRLESHYDLKGYRHSSRHE